MNLTCGMADRLLSAYVDGELQREEAKALAYHLAFCEDCLQEVRDLERTKQVLISEPKPAMPEEMAPDVEAWVTSRLAAARTPMGRKLTVGAGLVLAVGLLIAGLFRPQVRDRVSVDVFLAEHSRALTKTALQRRTTLVATAFYTEHAPN
jgi:anti-sigma factor RsiW